MEKIVKLMDEQIEKLKSLQGGKRQGSGRPKLDNKPFLVRCHPSVIKDVRKYAKERSQEEQQRIINQQKTEKL